MRVYSFHSPPYLLPPTKHGRLYEPPMLYTVTHCLVPLRRRTYPQTLADRPNRDSCLPYFHGKTLHAGTLLMLTFAVKLKPILAATLSTLVNTVRRAVGTITSHALLYGLSLLWKADLGHYDGCTLIAPPSTHTPIFLVTLSRPSPCFVNYYKRAVRWVPILKQSLVTPNLPTAIGLPARSRGRISVSSSNPYPTTKLLAPMAAHTRIIQKRP